MCSITNTSLIIIYDYKQFNSVDELRLPNEAVKIKIIDFSYYEKSTHNSLNSTSLNLKELNIAENDKIKDQFSKNNMMEPLESFNKLLTNLLS